MSESELSNWVESVNKQSDVIRELIRKSRPPVKITTKSGF